MISLSRSADDVEARTQKLMLIFLLFQALLLCAVVATVTAIENKKPNFPKSIKELGEEIRDRRNLEYSLTLPHSHVASFRSLERRITPLDGPQRSSNLYQGRNGYGLLKRSRPSLPAPPYAVQMEPMVQYSQKDPLYDLNGEHLEDGSHNEIQAQPKILTVQPGDQLADTNYVSGSIYSPHGDIAPPPGPPYGPVLVPYYEHPEPIIEIIIKESNESLPAPPVVAPPVGKRPKEPVQVFYVKYQQNPHGDGNDVIYDKPIPAITPPSNHEDHHYEEHTTVAPEVLTLSPPPSTTLRAIIHPDSERYHSDGGVHITFGTSEKRGHEYHDTAISEGHEESAPHVAVAFPQAPVAPTKQSPLTPTQFQKRQQGPARDQQPTPTQNFQQNVNFNQNQHHPQQRIQYQSNNQQSHQSHNFQHLPLQNTPSQSFRPVQTQFSRPPTAPLFSGPPQGPQISPQIQRSPPAGPPQHPPQLQHGPPIGPQHPSQIQHSPPAGPPQRPPHSYRPLSNFQQRPLPEAPRNFKPFPQQRPFHPGPQPQHFTQFNEHEYLQQNYHTITTEQLEPPRQQLLPSSKPGLNFREQTRPSLAPPFPLSQEEYNKRYQDQLQHLQQQERNRQRPPLPPPTTQTNTKFQQQSFDQQKKAPPSNLVSISQSQSINHHIGPHHQQFSQPQIAPQPRPSSPPQIQPHQVPGGQFIPPGGELIASVPKYEQHLLITPGPVQNTQQSQVVQSQSVHQQNSLTQTRVPPANQEFRNQIQQQFIDSNGAPGADFFSVFEQNQREILQLQEKLRKSEEEQQKLLALTQKSNPSTPSSVHQVNIQNDQYYLLKNQQQSNENNRQNQNVQIQGRNPQKPYVSHNTNRPPLISSTAKPRVPQPPSPTQYISSTPNSLPDKSESEKKDKKKKIEFELPDEVPDDLREQLLSSGILENAQISVLDYDKVGDIPLESLPPDQLANFYGAGGGLQISGSAPISSVVKTTGEKVSSSLIDDDENDESDQERASSEHIKSYVDSYGKKKDVEMKVVHFDPNTAKGSKVAEKYLQEGAKQVDPVSLDDQKYNRYLPLKVSGAQFPLPDVPELKGRKVTSVVVLAPVNYDFPKSDKEGGRSERAATNKLKGVNFVAGDALKKLVKAPSVENYKKWLEKENSTSPDLQSVVLLVTG